MKRDWPREAVSYQESVSRALRTLGGVEVARTAEADRTTRVSSVHPLLDQLGVLDLDPWGDEAESAAAVLAVVEAGAVVLPWPVVHQMSIPAAARPQFDGLYLADGPVRRLDHADLFDRAVLITADQPTGHRVLAGAVEPAPLDPFAVQIDIGEPILFPDHDNAVAMHHLLEAFWVGGALRTVVDLAARHARDRTQFGVPIGKFGEIRWHLADMVLARDGLEELALHTWWSARRGHAGTVDILALRLQMLEAATSALAHGHQVLAAMGLCEEHDLTVIDRHVQSALRRSGGVLGTTRRLAQHVATDGFDATFSVDPWRS
jgi:acyl-CoA dehydrogenase